MGGARTRSKPPPPPPPAECPISAQTRAVIICVDCDEPFDFKTHNALLDDLLKSPYITELRKALPFQIRFISSKSKAHFDNCDFQSAMDYLVALLNEVGSHTAAAEAAKASDKSAADAALLKASSHWAKRYTAPRISTRIRTTWNFKPRRWRKSPISASWRRGAPRTSSESSSCKAKAHLRRVFWGFPKKCPANTISHGDLAKDSPSTKSGQKLVAHLQNLSQHRVAAYLAREASLQLMRDAFKRWPQLRD